MFCEFFCTNVIKWRNSGIINRTFSYVFGLFFCFRGEHEINLTVIKGGPLPFAYDILTTAFSYGNRAFTEYPEGLGDYFKNSFGTRNPGYSWERSMIFEDFGVCLVTSKITLDE